MRQQRVHRPSRVTDRRRPARDDAQEEQERPEIREDIRHWFKER